MISLSGRDILHAWGKFALTGIGLGLLIGVTLTFAGVYRGLVDNAKVLLTNSGADLWVVQKVTLGRFLKDNDALINERARMRGSDMRQINIGAATIATLGACHLSLQLNRNHQ